MEKDLRKIKNEIIEIFNSRMEELKLTKYQVHKISGISQSSLTRYFKHENEMTLSAYLKLCNALQIRLYMSKYDFEGSEFESSINFKDNSQNES